MICVYQNQMNRKHKFKYEIKIDFFIKKKKMFEMKIKKITKNSRC